MITQVNQNKFSQDNIYEGHAPLQTYCHSTINWMDSIYKCFNQTLEIKISGCFWMPKYKNLIK